MKKFLLSWIIGTISLLSLSKAASFTCNSCYYLSLGKADLEKDAKSGLEEMVGKDKMPVEDPDCAAAGAGKPVSCELMCLNGSIAVDFTNYWGPTQFGDNEVDLTTLGKSSLVFRGCLDSLLDGKELKEAKKTVKHMKLGKEKMCAEVSGSGWGVMAGGAICGCQGMKDGKPCNSDAIKLNLGKPQDKPASIQKAKDFTYYNCTGLNYGFKNKEMQTEVNKEVAKMERDSYTKVTDKCYAEQKKETGRQCKTLAWVADASLDFTKYIGESIDIPEDDVTLTKDDIRGFGSPTGVSRGCLDKVDPSAAKEYGIEGMEEGEFCVQLNLTGLGLSATAQGCACNREGCNAGGSKLKRHHDPIGSGGQGGSINFPEQLKNGLKSNGKNINLPSLGSSGMNGKDFEQMKNAANQAFQNLGPKEKGQIKDMMNKVKGEMSKFMNQNQGQHGGKGSGGSRPEPPAGSRRGNSDESSEDTAGSSLHTNRGSNQKSQNSRSNSNERSSHRNQRGHGGRGNGGVKLAAAPVIIALATFWALLY